MQLKESHRKLLVKKLHIFFFIIITNFIVYFLYINFGKSIFHKMHNKLQAKNNTKISLIMQHCMQSHYVHPFTVSNQGA